MSFAKLGRLSLLNKFMTHLFTLEHFKKYSESVDRRMSTAAVILEDGDRVLIVKANYKSHWTFPGGTIDAGETPKQAAARELFEETNLMVDADKLTFAWVVSRVSKVAMTYQFLFRAKLSEVNLDDLKLQASEIEDWRIVTRAEILSNNLHYSKAAEAWARQADSGYLEHTFGED